MCGCGLWLTTTSDNLQSNFFYKLECVQLHAIHLGEVFCVFQICDAAATDEHPIMEFILLIDMCA
jgi:hypothetical protein